MPNQNLSGDIYVYSDGGSRGNPGPAACAFVVSSSASPDYRFQEGEYLGISTNNKAEYQGIINALNWLLSNITDNLNGNKISFFLDSELVVKQLNGAYRVKDPSMQHLYFQVQKKINELKTKFASTITITHIPRSKNFEADLLVNQTLDQI
jgi:ribonuclease HI